MTDSNLEKYSSHMHICTYTHAGLDLKIFQVITNSTNIIIFKNEQTIF